MLQRVDILFMQLKEAEERELSIKRMHATMMQALDDQDLRSKVSLKIDPVWNLVPERARNYAKKLDGRTTYWFWNPNQRVKGLGLY